MQVKPDSLLASATKVRARTFVVGNRLLLIVRKLVKRRRHPCVAARCALSSRTMSASVGVDIEALCSKCGDVWHVVVAMVGDTIAKVQCKECGGYHRYRSGKAAAKTAKTTTTKRKSAASKVSARIDTAQVEPDLSRPVRVYRASEPFALGDRIDHPTFGMGIVDGIPGDGKIDVFFPSGRKVLAQAKAASTLPPRPPRIVPTSNE